MFNSFMLANSSMRDDEFAEEINATINKLIFPKFLQKICKTFPLTFSMVYLLHRLCGVDAPALCTNDRLKHHISVGYV